MITSLTKEETIFPNAAPTIIPTAMSTAFPFIANSLNSVIMLIILSCWQDNVSERQIS